MLSASNGAFIAVVCARPACSYTPALDTKCHVLVLWRGRTSVGYRYRVEVVDAGAYDAIRCDADGKFKLHYTYAKYGWSNSSPTKSDALREFG